VIVVDTSALVSAIVGRPTDDRLLQRLIDYGDLHAPHLLDVEVLHALRGLVMGGKLAEHRAGDAWADFADLAIVRYPHGPLADRMWELRDRFTAYDAAFVTLAEALGAPLVTCDARLSAASRLGVQIELFEHAT